MFSIDKNEYVLENLAKTIKYECCRKGFDYKLDEIKYLALQEITNPLCNFSGAHSNLDKEINCLIDICIDFLCNQEAIFSVKTIIVQCYYTQWYKDKESVRENYRELITCHTNPLVVDICRSVATVSHEYENLYRKLVLAMLLLSGVGDATKKDSIISAEVALKSIFPIKNLEGFIHLSYQNKLKELIDLKKTVTGIILYNEFKLNQSAISSHQSTLLEEGSKVVLDKLSRTASCLDFISSVITQSLQDIIHFESNDQSIFVIETNPYLNNNNMYTAKSYTLLLQQCRRYIRVLLEDARDCQQEFYRLEDDYHYHVRSLLNELRGKVAISMNKVYSKFQEVGDIWTNEQELCVVFNTIHDTQAAILTLSEVHRMPDCLRSLCGNQGFESLNVEELAAQISQRMDQSFYYARIDPLMVQCEVVDITEENSHLLQYNGFCPVYCVESNGFLMDIRREIGVLEFQEKLYGFRDIKAAYVFGKDPKTYIDKVMKFVRSNVEYIEMLGLTLQAIEYRGTTILKDKRDKSKAVPVRDKDIQTETHPIESYIEPGYSWNVWNYKRNAVKLADIMQCNTKSTQSYLSNFRENAYAQTYSPRDKLNQTMKPNSMNTVDIPAETWTLRGKTPHIRVLSAECNPGAKRKS